jgi:predicted 3-demethylubiquinone-9 3-methyltransferase (glyoxalase superfamily)
MQKITTYLWFDKNAEEAMNFYTSLFSAKGGSSSGGKDSKIVSINYYPEGSDDPHLKGMEGKVINGIFELNGQRFMAIDGGPLFKFTEAISLYVDCEDQEEVDHLWEKLTADGGEESQCGWLKDKYGLSWQIIPKQLGELLGGSDPEKAGRAMQAMMQMQKIVIADLQKAYDGK